MKYLLTLLLAAVFSSSAFSQSEVKIGNQVWMSMNLDVSTFRNGETIPQAKNDKEWLNATISRKAAFCYYKYDPKNGEKYGKLYNWYAVIDSRGLAPQGYHIPSAQEWDDLIVFLGGSAIAGFKLKSTSGWANNVGGDNSSGFNGLPGGLCLYEGNFFNRAEIGIFWSSSKAAWDRVWVRYLYGNSGRAFKETYGFGTGLSVRCLRD